MKTKLCISLFGVLLVISVVAAIGLKRNIDLRHDICLKDEMLRKATVENIRKSWHTCTYAEDLMFIRSCSDIVSVVTNGQCTALKDYARAILQLSRAPSVRNCHDAESSLRKIFYDEFLWRNDSMSEFDGVCALDSYLRINFELMVHYANLDIRAGNFEVLPAKEYLALKTLKDYGRKFRADGNVEFERVANKYLDALIDHIESSDGYTRRCAHYTVALNTVLADAISPGRGVSNVSGLRLGRSIAQGLVKCGYTPKWLDKEFPVLDEKSDDQ